MTNIIEAVDEPKAVKPIFGIVTAAGLYVCCPFPVHTFVVFHSWQKITAVIPLTALSSSCVSANWIGLPIPQTHISSLSERVSEIATSHLRPRPPNSAIPINVAIGCVI